VKCDNITAVTRSCPESHNSIIMIAHSAFLKPHHDAIPTSSNCYPKSDQLQSINVQGKTHIAYIYRIYIKILGKIEEIIFEAKLFRDDTEPDEWIKPDGVIRGLHGYHLDMQCNIPVEKSKQCYFNKEKQTLEFDHFSVGSVMVLRSVCT